MKFYLIAFISVVISGFLRCLDIRTMVVSHESNMCNGIQMEEGLVSAIIENGISAYFRGCS